MYIYNFQLNKLLNMKQYFNGKKKTFQELNANGLIWDKDALSKARMMLPG